MRDFADFLLVLSFNSMIFPLMGCGSKLFSGTAINNSAAMDHETYARTPVAVSGASSKSRGATKTLENIREITMIVPAQNWYSSGATPLASPTDDIPFKSSSGSTISACIIGESCSNRMTAIQFNFTYPSNNFLLNNAHLVVNTQRDTSGTEGIFVDGVFSGAPPSSTINYSSSMIRSPDPSLSGDVSGLVLYDGAGASSDQNSYFIDQSLRYYAANALNGFDFDLKDLLSPTKLTYRAAISDGNVKVMLGDDSTVSSAYLVIKGMTVSDSSLSCVNSSTYNFNNLLLHADGLPSGNSPFFSGAASSLYQSSVSPDPSIYNHFNWHYTPILPQVKLANISLTKLQISGFYLRRKPSISSNNAALIVNGSGIAGSGFDRTQASSALTSWESDSVKIAAFENFVAQINTDSSATTHSAGEESNTTLNLLTFFSESTLKNALNEGKLVLSVAGSLVKGSASGQINTRMYSTTSRDTAITNHTSTASYEIGAKLAMEGTYFTEVCTVPDAPDSPLSETGLTETTIDAGLPPILSTPTVADVTANSAKIVWTTDVGTYDEIGYGELSSSENFHTFDTVSRYHEISLTSLKPYTWYKFQVTSINLFGNSSSSDVLTFMTKR